MGNKSELKSVEMCRRKGVFNNILYTDKWLPDYVALLDKLINRWLDEVKTM